MSIHAQVWIVHNKIVAIDPMHKQLQFDVLKTKL
jgi:hypothetical protein